ncbi:hypothetical protein [Terricaulis sp.]|uniref:hypothetical protein n=1 Tax=Terricaulis sp. TaxID=2768686 RepID=UPI0037832D15
MRAPLVLAWRDFRIAGFMASAVSSVTSLRAEARLLSLAGLILLAIGFPMTLGLAAIAISTGAVSPILPIALGAPPLLLGYLACHFASARMVKAKTLEEV